MVGSQHNTGLAGGFFFPGTVGVWSDFPLQLYPFSKTNPRKTDSLLWAICCQLLKPNSMAPSVNL